VPPDVWINSQGSNLAVRVGEEAELVRPRVGLFAADIWSRRRGLVLAGAGGERACRRSWCAMTVAGEVWVVWFGRAAPTADQVVQMCAGATGVVVRAEVAFLPEACRAVLVLDGRDLVRGSAELWREGGGWRGVWARDVQGERPWTPGS
jgi:competence protein ComEC